jgi:hypothetical protein
LISHVDGEKTIAFVIACLAFLGMLLMMGYTVKEKRRETINR